MEKVDMSPDNVEVRPQDTPNPYALKFICNFNFIEEGKITLQSAEECKGMPLVEGLLSILGVKQVYLFENTVTVTHDGSLPSDEVKDYVSAVIKTRMAVHNPNISASSGDQKTKKTTDRSDLSPELQAVEEILDRTIRPGLQADGGDVEVLSLESNELRILYMGACGGCPSAMMGTLDAIQNILRHELENETLIVIPT